MNLRKHTSWIVLITTVTLAAYDILPLFTEVDGDTISEVIRDWAPRWPIVSGGLSVLVGHFFIHPRWLTRPSWGPRALAALGLFYCVLSITSLLTGGWLYLPAWILVPTHILLGAWLWRLDPPER